MPPTRSSKRKKRAQVVTETPDETSQPSTLESEKEIPVESTINNVSETTEEFVETIHENGADENGADKDVQKPEEGKLTMEERQIKIEQLRQKMVRAYTVFHSYPLVTLFQ
jgi:hypothetical protein